MLRIRHTGINSDLAKTSGGGGGGAGGALASYGTMPITKKNKKEDHDDTPK